MKKLLYIAFSILVLTGCLPEKNSGGADAVRVEIAGRVFKIPKGYFDGAEATGKDTESVVLEYSLPGFEVLPPHPQQRAKRMELIHEGRLNGMLLENANKRPSFDQVMPLHMEGRKFKKMPSMYGLDHYVHQPEKAVRPGPEYAPSVEDDIYIEREKNGSIRSYLRCSPSGKDKIPLCDHRFINEGILYNISWRIQELPNWQRERDSAIKFIDSLEYKARD